MKSFPKLKNKLILAPMHNITNIAFRILCKKYGASLTSTELLSANALAREDNLNLKLAITNKSENPVSAQLFGQNTENMTKKIQTELLLREGEATEPFFTPNKISFEDFIKKINKSEFIFLGLRGGDGENGNFQKILSSKGIKFNGSDESTSRLCMDKFITGENP